MDFGEKPEGEAIDHNWQQISKRVFQGDRSQKLDRFAPSGKQRSWFWRNIGSKIDPKASEEDGMRNFPMMFKKVTPDELQKMQDACKSDKKKVQQQFRAFFQDKANVPFELSRNAVRHSAYTEIVNEHRLLNLSSSRNEVSNFSSREPESGTSSATSSATKQYLNLNLSNMYAKMPTMVKDDRG
jgi:hypothetical protein